jgi:hypothetical protein
MRFKSDWFERSKKTVPKRKDSGPKPILLELTVAETGKIKVPKKSENFSENFVHDANVYTYLNDHVALRLVTHSHPLSFTKRFLF